MKKTSKVTNGITAIYVRRSLGIAYVKLTAEILNRIDSDRTAARGKHVR